MPETDLLSVRRAAAVDSKAIYEVALLAFKTRKEAHLIDHLRPFDARFISLVAFLEERVVGHILFNPVTVEDKKAIALGVLAVHPDYQRQGIGSRLVETGLRACKRQGETVVFVLGRRADYPRFGFKLAAPRGLYFQAPGPNPSFFVKDLIKGTSRTLSGEVTYPDAFYTEVF